MNHKEFYEWKDKVGEILIWTVKLDVDSMKKAPLFTYFQMSMSPLEAAQAAVNIHMGRRAPRLQFEEEY